LESTAITDLLFSANFLEGSSNDSQFLEASQ